MTRTKSKLGTDKKLKSVSRRKPSIRFESTSSTTLAIEREYKKIDWNKYYQENRHPFIKFLLWTIILYLIVYIIVLLGRLVG